MSPVFPCCAAHNAVDSLPAADYQLAVVRTFLRWMTHSLWPPLVAVVICLLYLNIHGFPEPVCEFVRKQFRQNGYIVHFDSLRLDWFNGIVAQELVLADAARPEETLIRITEVVLQIQWMELMAGRNALSGLRIVNARISASMPPDELGSELLTASGAHATLRFEPHGVIHIEQLTGMYCGVFLYVTGRITQAGAQRPVKPLRADKLSIISTALRELHGVRSGAPLDLYLDFDVNLDQPMELRARVRLHGNRLRYRRLAIHSIELDVGMEEGAIRIHGASARLAGGELQISGSYDLGKGQTDLRLKSTFDLTVLRPLLPPDVEKALPPFQFFQHPDIALRYLLSPETGTVPVLSGTIKVGEMAFRDVEFRAITFDFENRGPEIKISDARVVMRKGALTGHGQYHIESSDFAYEFDSTLDPTTLLPLMTPIMQRWVSPCGFEEPPHIVAKVRGDFVDPDAFAYDAEVTAAGCSYRGVPLQQAAGSLRLRRNRLDVRDLVLQREDGQLTGELTADFDYQQLIFNMRSTANPVPMAAMLGPTAAKTMEPYRFGTNLNAAAKGFIDFANPDRVAWSADVRDEDFSWWKLTAARSHGQLQFHHHQCRLELDAEGVTYGTNRAERVTTVLLISTNRVNATGVSIKMDGGRVSGTAAADVPRQRVDFQFQSTADPRALASWLGPKAAKQLEPYQFGSNTVVRASGVADMLESNQTCWAANLVTDGFAHNQFTAERLDADLSLTNDILRVQARSQGSRWWKFGAERLDADLVHSNAILSVQARSQGLTWWKLKAEQATATLTASTNTLAIRDFDATVCGGTLRGQADIQAIGTNTAFQFALDAQDSDIRRILQCMGNPDPNASGRLKGRLELAGAGSELDTFRGQGSFEIAEGVLLEVPVFGIFSRILNLVVPGLGSASVTKANCTYNIANGQVKTDDLQFETGAAAVRSRGVIGLARGDLDFRVEAQPLRSWPGINILTWMFGKIFEYKIGGTIDNPNWRPTRLPKEILPHSGGKPAESKPDNP